MKMLPNHIRNGIILGLILLLIGIAVHVIPNPGPIQIDSGPSSRLVFVSGFIFYGLLIIIFSGIFWLRHLISNYQSDYTSEV